MSTETKTRTITLTARPPVRIREDLWPVIAAAYAFDSEYECQANRTWLLQVRQHKDGRAIVCGLHTTVMAAESDLRAGELLAAGDDIVGAIRTVAVGIGASDRLAQECIADLPAENLDAPTTALGGSA